MSVSNRYSFDTNIYFYSLDSSTGQKHILAKQLLAEADPLRTMILMQTLGELTNAILKRRPNLIDPTRRLSRHMSNLHVLAAVPQDIVSALAAHEQHGLPFWDAMIWSVADRAGCDILFSEDLQDGRILGNVTFVNPFKSTPGDLATLLG